MQKGSNATNVLIRIEKIEGLDLHGSDKELSLNVERSQRDDFSLKITNSKYLKCSRNRRLATLFVLFVRANHKIEQRQYFYSHTIRTCHGRITVFLFSFLLKNNT